MQSISYMHLCRNTFLANKDLVTSDRAEMIFFFIQFVHHFLRILANIRLFLQYNRFLRMFANFLQDLTFFIVTSVKSSYFIHLSKEVLKDCLFQICALLGYYAAYSGHLLPTFREKLLVKSSRVKKTRRILPLKVGPISCPETSVTNYHSALRNSPEELRSHLIRGGSLKSRLPVLYRTVPYHTIPCRAVRYRTIPNHTVPYRNVTCRTVSCRTVPYRAVTYRTLTYLTVP